MNEKKQTKDEISLMTANDLKSELKNWKFTRYKAINFAIGILALLIYESIGRPIFNNNFRDPTL